MVKEKTINDHISAILLKLDKLGELDVLDKKIDNTNCAIADISADLKKLNCDIDINKKLCCDRQTGLEIKIQDNNEAMHKSLEVVVSGISCNTFLTPKEIYQRLVEFLGYSSEHFGESNIQIAPKVNCFWFGGENRQLLLKFISIFEKEELMYRYYRNSTNVTLHSLGISEGIHERIYLQHNLTTLRYQAFKLAIEQRKSNRISAIRIRSGSVLTVKLPGRAHFQPISSVDELRAVLQIVPASSRKI